MEGATLMGGEMVNDGYIDEGIRILVAAYNDKSLIRAEALWEICGQLGNRQTRKMGRTEMQTLRGRKEEQKLGRTFWKNAQDG